MKQKYCLQSVIPFKSINESLFNHSKAKQTHAFSRQSRFQPNDSICPISTYDGKVMKGQQKGGVIGSSKRQTFTLEAAYSPGSNRYNINNTFDSNVSKNKGYTLTLNREKMGNNSYINKNGLKLPGVGKYHLQTETVVRTNRAPAYSLRKKTRVQDVTRTIEAQNKNPSPADYENNPENHKSQTNFKQLFYSSSRSKRFISPHNAVPGPGQYENPTNLSKSGRYIVSSHRGGTKAKFDNSKRVTEFEKVERAARRVPGPGSYRQSSEFGQYDGQVYERSSSRRLLSQRF